MFKRTDAGKVPRSQYQMLHTQKDKQEHVNHYVKPSSVEKTYTPSAAVVTQSGEGVPPREMPRVALSAVRACAHGLARAYKGVGLSEVGIIVFAA